MHKICPRCVKSVGVKEEIQSDAVSKKMWLISKCCKCGFNFDLEEWDNTAIMRSIEEILPKDR